MKQSAKIGLKGEAIAIAYLRKQNHKILFQNWRHKHLEVDIISQTDTMIVFTEVKTRSNMDFGEPQQFVTKGKQQHLLRAANAYCYQFDYHGEIRFDIIAIFNDKENKEDSVLHIEDAFYQYG
jgi:putative endonuclease